tara:strand:- start:135 stop:365 length:231 start_codon:yes stop_codon:yes gene_type:complete
MVVTVQEPTDPVVVLLLRAVVEQKLTLVILVVMVRPILALQVMDLAEVVVPVVLVLMDPPAHKQQLLEVTEHQIVF